MEQLIIQGLVQYGPGAVLALVVIWLGYRLVVRILDRTEAREAQLMSFLANLQEVQERHGGILDRLARRVEEIGATLCALNGDRSRRNRE